MENNNNNKKEELINEDNLESLSNHQLLHLLPRISDPQKANFALGLLMSNVDRLSGDELTLLLSIIASKNPKDSAVLQEPLIHRLAAGKWKDVKENTNMFFLISNRFLSTESQQLFLSQLLTKCKANQLSSAEMFQLMKLYFLSPPRDEVQLIMNMLYQRELQRPQQQSSAAEKPNRIGLLLPQGWGEIVAESCNTINRGIACDGCTTNEFLGTRYNCLQCNEFDLCESCYCKGIVTKKHLATHPMRAIVQTLQIFKRMPNSEDNYFIDIKFASVLQTGHFKTVHPASIMLLSNIDSTIHGSVFLSTSPYHKENTHFLGTLTADSPSLPLTYPLPQPFGAIPMVRIGVVFSSSSSASPYKGNTHAQVGVERGDLKLQTHEPIVSSAFRHGSNDVVVCFGEVHSFRLDQEDNFSELLMRAAKRWNLSFDEFELQDENYKTFKVEEKALSTLRKSGTIVLRLVKKPNKWNVLSPERAVFAPAPIFSPPTNPPQFNPNLFNFK